MAVGVDGTGAIAHAVITGLSRVSQGVCDQNETVLRVIVERSGLASGVDNGSTVVISVIAIFGHQIQAARINDLAEQSVSDVVVKLGNLEGDRVGGLGDLFGDLDLIAFAVVPVFGCVAQRVGLLD